MEELILLHITTSGPQGKWMKRPGFRVRKSKAKVTQLQS